VRAALAASASASLRISCSTEYFSRSCIFYRVRGYRTDPRHYGHFTRAGIPGSRRLGAVHDRFVLCELWNSHCCAMSAGSGQLGQSCLCWKMRQVAASLVSSPLTCSTMLTLRLEATAWYTAGRLMAPSRGGDPCRLLESGLRHLLGKHPLVRPQLPRCSCLCSAHGRCWPRDMLRCTCLLQAGDGAPCSQAR
jgi:hypothetical protein